MDSIISGLYGLMNHHAPELPKSWKQADEQDSWRDKAKDVILKKIKKEKGLAALEDFRRILTIQNSNTNCLLVDKSKDGRWQVHHLKGLPHVFVCRIWRWPDLRSYCELRTAQNSNCSHPYVHHSKSNHQKVMCINPYHYVKATSSATVPPPVLVPRHFDPMPTSSSSSTLDENYLQPGGTTNWVVEPTNNILNNQSQPRQENDLAMPSSHMSSGLVSHSDLSFSTMDFEHEPVYYHEPEDYWCKVAYFETNDRVGELYHAKNDVFQIDGFTNPRMDANRFSLGQLCNIKRNSSIENTRRHIGKGVRLVNQNGKVYLECLSDRPIFVQSQIGNIFEGVHQFAVWKMNPNSSKVVYDGCKFSEILERCAKLGYKHVYELTKMCQIKISFVKGWGSSEYHRQEITSTPCWVEINLFGPLKWLDDVLKVMPNYSEPITSFT